MKPDGALATARLARMSRMSEKRDDLCWADLATGAMGMSTYPGWLHDAQSRTRECRRDAKRDGSCYCGQFREE